PNSQDLWADIFDPVSWLKSLNHDPLTQHTLTPPQITNFSNHSLLVLQDFNNNNHKSVMEFNLEEGKHLYDECSTLILPALSIGNVGQLAVDLLIASSKADRVGYLDDPNVLPCVGNDAYAPSPQGDLALPLEAYESPSSALTFIQQRSPVVKI
ncbi:hypothetical protein M8C21_008831, partial [Ambrosia artemisiifolia]